MKNAVFWDIKTEVVPDMRHTFEPPRPVTAIALLFPLLPDCSETGVLILT
jgi:hypothetical protein